LHKGGYNIKDGIVLMRGIKIFNIAQSRFNKIYKIKICK